RGRPRVRARPPRRGTPPRGHRRPLPRAHREEARGLTMSSSGPVLLVFGIASALSALLVPVSKRLAARFGVLDAPGPRKNHAEPTPRLGGVAVFVAFTSVVVAGYLLRPILAMLPAAQSLFGTALDVLQEAYKVQGKL